MLSPGFVQWGRLEPAPPRVPGESQHQPLLDGSLFAWVSTYFGVVMACIRHCYRFDDEKIGMMLFGEHPHSQDMILPFGGITWAGAGNLVWIAASVVPTLFAVAGPSDDEADS